MCTTARTRRGPRVAKPRGSSDAGHGSRRHVGAPDAGHGSRRAYIKTESVYTLHRLNRPARATIMSAACGYGVQHTPVCNAVSTIEDIRTPADFVSFFDGILKERIEWLPLDQTVMQLQHMGQVVGSHAAKLIEYECWCQAHMEQDASKCKKRRFERKKYKKCRSLINVIENSIESVTKVIKLVGTCRVVQSQPSLGPMEEPHMGPMTGCTTQTRSASYNLCTAVMQEAYCKKCETADRCCGTKPSCVMWKIYNLFATFNERAYDGGVTKQNVMDSYSIMYPLSLDTSALMRRMKAFVEQKHPRVAKSGKTGDEADHRVATTHATTYRPTADPTKNTKRRKVTKPDKKDDETDPSDTEPGKKDDENELYPAPLRGTDEGIEDLLDQLD